MSLCKSKQFLCVKVNIYLNQDQFVANYQTLIHRNLVKAFFEELPIG